MDQLSKQETFVLVTSFINARYAKYNNKDAFKHADKQLEDYKNGTKNTNVYCNILPDNSCGSSGGGS